VNACVSRSWIFVSPDYRLLPEATAHDAVDDAVDAYQWVRAKLPALLGRKLGSVLVAGASAGGYLALTTAAQVAEKPDKLLLVYGMLDAAGPRYTTPGTKIFGRPVVDTKPILQEWPLKNDEKKRKKISAYPVSPQTIATDRRFALASALHIDALFPDYMTGVHGLAKTIATEGIEGIPTEHRRLFPLSFGDLSQMPPTMLLHGINDSAVPVECSRVAEDKLRAAVGTQVAVVSEFPENAEHGFDAGAGTLDVEKPEADDVQAVESLRRVIRFLDGTATPLA
jgi:acetyl esterase/lipase